MAETAKSDPYAVRWPAVRAALLRQHPTCAKCGKPETEPQPTE